MRSCGGSGVPGKIVHRRAVLKTDAVEERVGAMNYETMHHLNRERLDRRVHEATNERLARADTDTARHGWSWLAAVRSRLFRPALRPVRRSAPQPQL